MGVVMSRRKSGWLGPADQVRDSKGRLIDEEYVRRAVEDVHRVLGRPSLSGMPSSSPQVVVRMPPQLRDAAKELAAREGITLSELTRRALEEHIQRAG